jgi:YVTN family beta-propeller protein
MTLAAAGSFPVHGPDREYFASPPRHAGQRKPFCVQPEDAKMKLSKILPAALVPLCLGLAISVTSAAAPAGLKAYVGNFKDSTVSVIDVAAGRVQATLPVAAGPDGIVVSLDDRLAFVSGAGASAVSVIDTASDSVVRTIEVGKGPQGLALTPDGRWVLAAVNGDDRVAFIDAATQSVAASVTVARPHTIAVRPGGAQAWVTSQQPGHFSLAVIDLAQRKVVATVALEKTPRDLEFSADGSALYVTLAGVAAVQVVDPAAQRIVGQVPTGISPHIAQHFPGMALGMVVVQGPGELLLFDPATRAAVRSVAVGRQPHWVDIVPGARQALVTNEGSNDVSVVDVEAGKVTATITVGQAPRKVAVQHGAAVKTGARVVIDNFAFAPGDIAVARGQTVQWLNRDGAPHGLAFKDGAPGTELMLPGQGFSRRFDKPGVYDYICSVHPYMTARVTVQ